MNKTITTALMATLIGALVALFGVNNAEAQTKQPRIAKDNKSKNTELKYPLRAKLQRFEIVEGKEQRFNEWMDFLRAEREAAVETLENEKMYFEAVFSDTVDGKTYAFWLTFQGEGGKPVESSKHELDKKHLEFWNECIKKNSRKVFESEFYLTPKFYERAIMQHQMKEKE